MDDIPEIPPPSTFMVSEAQTPRVILYDAQSQPLTRPVLAIGFVPPRRA